MLIGHTEKNHRFAGCVIRVLSATLLRIYITRARSYNHPLRAGVSYLLLKKYPNVKEVSWVGVRREDICGSSIWAVQDGDWRVGFMFKSDEHVYTSIWSPVLWDPGNGCHAPGLCTVAMLCDLILWLPSLNSSHVSTWRFTRKCHVIVGPITPRSHRGSNPSSHRCNKY